MYIYSTNLIADRNLRIMPSWFTSEKYYNCESIYSSESKPLKSSKFFGRKAANKK